MYNQKYLSQLVAEIAEREGFSKNAKTLFSNAQEKGQGYMGVIEKVDIEENEEKLNLITKISKRNDTIRVIAPVDEAYKNEVQFYRNIYPALENVQLKLDIEKPFQFVPKLYACGEENEDGYFIFENLKEQGYEIFNLKDDLDEEHCIMICELIGKFHAISFALKYSEPEEYAELISKLQCIHLGFMRYRGGFIKQTAWVLQRSLKEIGKCNKMIDNYVENIEKVYKDVLYRSKNDKYSCIIHCDGWSNNFMFKYKYSNGKRFLEDIKLLDWQACYYGSPVIDLSFALYSGASKNVLNNLDTYLRIYHNALTTYFPQSKINMAEIYPFEVLKAQWNRYCEFGVIRGLLVLKVKTTREEDIESMKSADETDSPASFGRIIDAKCDNEETFKKIRQISDHLEGLGVF